MLILHLSDIHFRRTEVETAQDPNFHLRNELLRDIRTQCAKLGAPDVIVVSGDIAFAGHPDEFLFATDWLKKLCKDIGSDLKCVFVCPGNHDAVRSKADSQLIQLIHDEFKRQQPGELDHKIGSTLLDEAAARLLYGMRIHLMKEGNF